MTACSHQQPLAPGTRHRRAAFTLLEMLIAMGILVVLVSILVPVVSNVRKSGKQVKCLSNLRQLAVGFVVYAADNRGMLPDPRELQESWESLLVSKLPSGGLFECPADDELFATLGSSYDWRDTGDPLSTLAGYKLTLAPTDAVLTFDSLPGWHAKHSMNAAFPDGSARALTERECLGNLSKPLRHEALPMKERGN